ncbi:MAG: T9SS type A sorting domain-containing protein [Bacteroidia bacterium]|nr:T9SS type A sorting domain-containing protein [Bacteroidia bacterium]
MNIIKYLLLILISVLFFEANVISQTRPIGSWKSYLSLREGRAGAEKGDEIFVLTTGGLYSYNKISEEINSYSTVEGLSSLNGTAIYYAPETDRIYLGFTDGTINFFEDPGELKFLTDIRRNQTFPNKVINDFFEADGFLYVATGFGLVVFNQETGLPVTDIAQFADNAANQSVNSVTVFGDRIWITLENGGLYFVDKNFPNLRDPSAWTAYTANSNLTEPELVTEVASNNKGIYVINPISFYASTDGFSWESTDSNLERSWEKLHVGFDQVGVSGGSQVMVRNAVGTLDIYSLATNVADVVLTTSRLYFNVTISNGLDIFDAFQRKQVLPEGPKTNETAEITAGNGRMYIAPKGFGPNFVPTGSSAGIYSYSNASQSWTILDTIKGSLPSIVGYGIARIVYDQNSGKTYAGSWGQGVIELEDTTVTDFYTCEEGLPTIDGVCAIEKVNFNTRTSGLAVDPNGKLWACFDDARPPLAVRNEDGSWATPPPNLFPTDFRATNMIIDDWSSKWMVIKDKGILVYTENNTPDDPLDGEVLFLRNSTGQGGLPSNQIFDLAKDQDGFIWVGTSKGAAVFFDPFSISQGVIVDATQTILDGRRLLALTSVFAVAVDGGNRKWFGTNEGVFLISEDGDEQIQQFTTENSPLPSNEIIDITIDQSTGEVFIATDKGLVSYWGDATEGSRECEDVLVYPNPVTPDHDGDIIIQGSSRNSTVNIVTVSGTLVRKLTAQGGTAVWDGRDVRGNRVKSGVYMALISDDNGENACIGKFTLIGR